MQFLPFVPHKCQACGGEGREEDREWGGGGNVNDRDGTSLLWLSRFLSAALTFEQRTKREDCLHSSQGGEGVEGREERMRRGVEGLVESVLGSCKSTVCLAGQMSQRSNKLKSLSPPLPPLTMHCHRSCQRGPPLSAAPVTQPLLLLLHVHFVVQRRTGTRSICGGA